MNTFNFMGKLKEDLAWHGIYRFKRDDLRPSMVQLSQFRLQVFHVVMFEDLLLQLRTTNTRNHRCMVLGVGPSQNSFLKRFHSRCRHSPSSLTPRFVAKQRKCSPVGRVFRQSQDLSICTVRRRARHAVLWHEDVNKKMIEENWRNANGKLLQTSRIQRTSVRSCEKSFL